MGHYDNFYDDEREEKRRKIQEESGIARIQEAINKYGIAKTLYLIKIGMI